MLKWIMLTLKGILFGISNLIPGGSGGTTLVVCGIYEETLESITNLKKEFKKSFLFLLFLLIGTVIGVVTGSLLIKKILLVSIPFITYCIFAGFIIGTLPNLVKPYIKKINIKYLLVFH
jgi:putative membrane protein